MQRCKILGNVPARSDGAAGAAMVLSDTIVVGRRGDHIDKAQQAPLLSTIHGWVLG